MERKRRVRAIWGLAGAVLAVAAIVVPLLVLAGSGQATLTAETYADVIRFGVQGAGTLQIQIYDLSEREIWDSGAVSSDFVDWDRTDTWGERLANGYYMYLARAWDMSENLILSKTGKVALLPGDQVQLQAAPAASTRVDDGGISPGRVSTMWDTGSNFTIAGRLGVGTENLNFSRISLSDGSAPEASAATLPWEPTLAVYGNGKAYFVGRDVTNDIEYAMGVSILGGAFVGSMTAHDLWFRTNNVTRMTIKSTTGYVGIGTTDATDKLTIQGATGNLIACYPDASRTPGSAVFRVESDGDAYADGSVYANSFVIASGAADVAERINVSEWVEAGNVVEIDPKHPGFFCKSAGAYSTRVAGIVSTSPGVVLGQRANSESDPWDDTRPVLAIAGRVPVKVTTENGPLAVGDLLVASSTPGVAMKGDPSTSIGCVVGKAMEPFAEGEGVVMAQVMLR